MPITQVDHWAANPSTTRATAVHLSYDPKSDRIAYASGKSIFLRSVSNPSEVVQFEGHTTADTTVAKFSPSGFYIASGDAYGNVKIWDCVGEDLIVKGEYQVISGRINDIAWDADSQRIIAVGDGKERYGHCFTFDSGNTVGEISGHSAPINAVSVKPCRPYRAATVADDAGLVFLQGPPFKFSSSTRGHHTNFVRDVAFSKDGNFIVSVGADRQIVVYDGKTGEFIKKLEQQHEGGIFGVSWVVEKPDQFVTCSADSTIRLWDVNSGECLKVWSIEKKLENHFLGVVSTKDFIVALSLSGDFYYFNESSSEPIRIIYGHNKSITALSFSPESGIHSASYDGRILSWDIKSKEAKLVEGDLHTNLVVGLNPLKNGTVVSASWDDTLKAVSGTIIKSGTKLDKQPIAISSYDNTTAVIFEDEIAIYEDFKKVKDLKLGYKPSGVDISSKLIVVGDANTFAINLYNRDLTPVSGTLPPLRAEPAYMKVSPNGEYLAAADVTGKIFCYSLSDFSLKTSKWVFHKSRVSSIAWHEDNDHIVSAASDLSIYIYSVSKPIRNIPCPGAHKGGVTGAVWLDSNTVLTCGGDATLKTWKVEF